MRLNIAADLIYVIRYTESKKSPSANNKSESLVIQELFQLSQSNLSSKIKKEFQESMDLLITWLFLNAR